MTIINETKDERFTIEVVVRTFGIWTLGWGWCDVIIGPQIKPTKITGLALYIHREKGEPYRRLVFGVKGAVGFFAEHKVPPKLAAKVICEAQLHDDWDK
jgi:hypothetical protein